MHHRTGARPARAATMEAEAASGGALCEVGIVRTKPGRGERTCCMSCSDKIARWNAVGVQGALLTLLVPPPIRLASVTVGGVCLSRRLRRALARGSNDVTLHEPPTVGSTQLLFQGGPPREQTSGGVSAPVPCSNSIAWAPSGRGELHEAINGLVGKRLGANIRNPSPKHRSSLCKVLVLQRFYDVLNAMPIARVPAVLLQPQRNELSYAEIKALSAAYQQRKRALMAVGAAFEDWIKAPACCESFTQPWLDVRCRLAEEARKAEAEQD